MIIQLLCFELSPPSRGTAGVCICRFHLTVVFVWPPARSPGEPLGLQLSGIYGCICVAAREEPWGALGVQLSGIYDCICVAAREEPWGALGLQLSGICGSVYVSFASVVCICY